MDVQERQFETVTHCVDLNKNENKKILVSVSICEIDRCCGCDPSGTEGKHAHSCAWDILTNQECKVHKKPVNTCKIHGDNVQTENELTDHQDNHLDKNDVCNDPTEINNSTMKVQSNNNNNFSGKTLENKINNFELNPLESQEKVNLEKTNLTNIQENISNESKGDIILEPVVIANQKEQFEIEKNEGLSTETIFIEQNTVNQENKVNQDPTNYHMNEIINQEEQDDKNKLQKVPQCLPNVVFVSKEQYEYINRIVQNKSPHRNSPTNLSTQDQENSPNLNILGESNTNKNEEVIERNPDLGLSQKCVEIEENTGKIIQEGIKDQRNAKDETIVQKQSYPNKNEDLSKVQNVSHKNELTERPSYQTFSALRNEMAITELNYNFGHQLGNSSFNKIPMKGDILKPFSVTKFLHNSNEVIASETLDQIQETNKMSYALIGNSQSGNNKNEIITELTENRGSYTETEKLPFVNSLQNSTVAPSDVKEGSDILTKENVKITPSYFPSHVDLVIETMNKYAENQNKEDIIEEKINTSTTDSIKEAAGKTVTGDVKLQICTCNMTQGLYKDNEVDLELTKIEYNLSNNKNLNVRPLVFNSPNKLEDSKEIFSDYVVPSNDPGLKIKKSENQVYQEKKISVKEDKTEVKKNRRRKRHSTKNREPDKLSLYPKYYYERSNSCLSVIKRKGKANYFQKPKAPGNESSGEEQELSSESSLMSKLTICEINRRKFKSKKQKNENKSLPADSQLDNKTEGILKTIARKTEVNINILLKKHSNKFVSNNRTDNKTDHPTIEKCKSITISKDSLQKNETSIFKTHPKDFLKKNYWSHKKIQRREIPDVLKSKNNFKQINEDLKLLHGEKSLNVNKWYVNGTNTTSTLKLILPPFTNKRKTAETDEFSNSESNKTSIVSKLIKLLLPNFEQNNIHTFSNQFAMNFSKRKPWDVALSANYF